MWIPNADQAVVSIEKLRLYALNPSSRLGEHKARVLARLGFTTDDCESLRQTLLEVVRTRNDAFLGRLDQWGQRYALDFILEGRYGSAKVRSGWIIRTGEDFPRLTTFYVRRE